MSLIKLHQLLSVLVSEHHHFRSKTGIVSDTRFEKIYLNLNCNDTPKMSHPQIQITRNELSQAR